MIKSRHLELKDLRETLMEKLQWEDLDDQVYAQMVRIVDKINGRIGGPDNMGQFWVRQDDEFEDLFPDGDNFDFGGPYGEGYEG